MDLTTVTASIDIDTSGVDKGLADGVSKSRKAGEDIGDAVADGIESKSQRLTDGVNAAFVPAAAAMAALVGGAGLAIHSAEEAQVANARLAQVLANMGYEQATARVTAYAESLSMTIGQEDETIKLVQAKLATFSQLTESVGEAGGAFDRATVAAFDLGAVFGGAESGAVSLGKALQDPENGLAALKRQGVGFSEAQKEMIVSMMESGRAAEAQNIIFAEIEKQVGGTAEATATGSSKMKIALGETGEAIGNGLLPAFNRLLPKILQFSNWAQTHSGLIIKIGVIVGTFAASILALKLAITVVETVTKSWSIVTSIASGVQWALVGSVNAETGARNASALSIGRNMLALAAMKTAQVAGAVATGIATAAQWAWNVALTANPIGIIIVAIGALVAALVWFFTQTDLGRAIFETAMSAISTAVGWISDAIGKVIEWVKQNWPTILAILTGPVGLAVKWIIGNWDSIVAFVKGIPAKLAEVGKAIVNAVTWPWRTAFNLIIDGLNWVTSKWNDLKFDVPKIEAFGQEFGGFTIGAPQIAQIPHIPELAEGGILKARPGGVLFRGAEAGQDEAVIPLSKLPQYGGQAGNTFHFQITVESGAVADEATIERTVRRTINDAFGQGVQYSMALGAA